MSNKPGGGANLGSALAQVGYVYNPAGANAMLKATAQLVQAGGGVNAAQLQQAAGAKAVTTSSQSLAQQQGRLAAVQQQLALASTNVAGRVKILAAEYQQLAAAARVAGLSQEELTRRQIAATQAQLKLQQATNAQQRAGQARAGAGANVLQLAAAVGVATTGVEAVSAIANMAREGNALIVTLTTERKAVGALFGDVARGNKVYAEAIAFGQKYRFTQAEMGEAAQAASLLIRDGNSSVEKTFEVLARLQAKAPDKSFADAVRAVTELQAGQFQSLERIFNIPAAAVQGLSDKIKAGADPIEALDGLLNKMGITVGILQTRTEGATGAQNDYNVAIEGFKLALGDLVQSSGWTQFKTFLAEAGTGLLGGKGVVSTARDQAKAEVDAIVASSKTILEVRERVAAREAEIDQQVIDARNRRDSAGALRSAALRGGFNDQKLPTDPASLQAAQQQVKANADAVASLAPLADLMAATGRVYRQFSHEIFGVTDAQDQLNAALAAAGAAQTGVQRRYTGAAAAARSASADLAKETADLQANLGAAVLQGATDLVTGQRVRNKALLDLDKQYTDADGKLFGKLAAELKQAGIDGVNERAALQASAGLAASRQAEDRGRQDARTARSRREEDAASATSYAQSRAALIASQHAQGVKDEEQYQRDLARATRDGQENQYVSTASFLERLFALTRGHRNKAELAAGQAALKAAQAEAAELAKTDPAAAAALLAERERQLTDAIQRKRDEAQLRRDAKRGGGLSPADVEAEIAQEDAATKAANDATVAGIKAGAKDKADDRTRQKAETDKANKTAVDDLDKNEAERRAKLSTARKEQDGDLAADRAREDLRRGQDFAKQLHDFDVNQAIKIGKINDAIKDEKTKYGEARQAIIDTYKTLGESIQAKIDEAKAKLDLTPTPEQQAAQLAAFYTLGGAMGQKWVDGVTDKLGLPRIVFGKGTGSVFGGGLPGTAPGVVPRIAPPPPPPRRHGGAQDINSQSLNSMSLWDRPVLPPPSTTAGRPIFSPTITVALDLRGASGIDLAAVRREVKLGASEALDAFERGLLRETGDLATRGALR